jgi:hypothetical protein
MHPTRSFRLSCLALVALAALSGQAFSATVAVGACTKLVSFATIQSAVNEVPSGSTIKVCPGIYPEQVVISKPLTLEGIADATGDDAAVIVPPNTGMVANASDVTTGNPIAAQVLVYHSSASISNLTVDGTGNGIAGCTPDLQGILIQFGSDTSNTVNHVAVRNQIPGGIVSDCQSGEAIEVQGGCGGIGIYEPLAVNNSPVTVENSSVHNYNTNGITVCDGGGALTVTGNYIQGSGVAPSGGAVQYGIQIYGHGGTISGNTVIDNIYGDPTVATSADILLYDTYGGTVADNIVGNSQFPIVLYDDDGSSGSVSVKGNKIFGAATYDGIDACTTYGNTITGNTIFNSAESGVHFDASCGSLHGNSPSGNGNTATKNAILESACAGILADPGTTGNTSAPNTFYTVPFRVTSSTSSCPFVAGSAMAKTKAVRKFRPLR